MHGLIFLQLQRFARQAAGVGAWEILLREANLPTKSYSAVRTYADEEMLALVSAASRILNKPIPNLIESFGEFIAPELIRLYGRLIQPDWKTLDVIENTEKLIHSAVRVGNPGAKPPVLECIRTTPEELQLIYSSERQLCVLARGIVTGLARHFGETVSISEDACMSRGDPFCLLHMRLETQIARPTQVPAILETGIYHDKLPFVTSPVMAPTVHEESFPFLKPPQQPDEIGRLGEFRVLQLLGQGGMGIVFRAEDSRLGRLVALKVMQPRFASDATMRQRFLREARAMAAIKSDYVITVYEVGSTNDLPFLAMEFLEGETLEAYHNKVGRVPLPLVVRVGRETALGLEAAHSRGLIHRDIKPENIWLESDTKYSSGAGMGGPSVSPRPGRVKILDFGLARVNTDPSQISKVGMVLGTPAFMSPEQARGQAVDYRADLFSLGCVLYWLSTNERPFEGSDLLSTLTALAVHDPQPPQTISQDVPEPLSLLIMQLIKKDPSQRPKSAKEVADALAEIQQTV